MKKFGCLVVCANNTYYGNKSQTIEMKHTAKLSSDGSVRLSRELTLVQDVAYDRDVVPNRKGNTGVKGISHLKAQVGLMTEAKVKYAYFSHQIDYARGYGYIATYTEDAYDVVMNWDSVINGPTSHYHTWSDFDDFATEVYVNPDNNVNSWADTELVGDYLALDYTDLPGVQYGYFDMVTNLNKEVLVNLWDAPITEPGPDPDASNSSLTTGYYWGWGYQGTWRYGLEITTGVDISLGASFSLRNGTGYSLSFPISSRKTYSKVVRIKPEHGSKYSTPVHGVIFDFDRGTTYNITVLNPN